MALYSGPPVKSLDAVTSPGAGKAYQVTWPLGSFTMQTVVTGAPSGVSCTLQASLDGVTYTTIATSTSTTGDSQSITGKPAAYFRANLGTLTGGTTPTVTAFVVAT